MLKVLCDFNQEAGLTIRYFFRLFNFFSLIP